MINLQEKHLDFVEKNSVKIMVSNWNPRIYYDEQSSATREQRTISWATLLMLADFVNIFH